VLSCFHRIPECKGRTATDRQTDGHQYKNATEGATCYLRIERHNLRLYCSSIVKVSRW